MKLDAGSSPAWRQNFSLSSSEFFAIFTIKNMEIITKVLKEQNQNLRNVLYFWAFLKDAVSSK